MSKLKSILASFLLALSGLSFALVLMLLLKNNIKLPDQPALAGLVGLIPILAGMLVFELYHGKAKKALSSLVFFSGILVGVGITIGQQGETILGYTTGYLLVIMFWLNNFQLLLHQKNRGLSS